MMGCLFLCMACIKTILVQVETLRYEENLMNIAKEFKFLAKEWAEHYQNVGPSSNMQDFLNHSAYRKLVELGQPAIPYIIEQYKKDELPWGFVLDEITGLHKIEKPNCFSPPEVKIRWLEWWEQQKIDQQRRLDINLSRPLINYAEASVGWVERNPPTEVCQSIERA